METFLTGRQIGGRVGGTRVTYGQTIRVTYKGGIPTFLLQDVIAKLWTEQEIKNYPSA